MRLTLYCAELRASGGRSVGIGLLESLARDPLGHEITAYVPPDPGYIRLGGGAIRIVPTVSRSGVGLLVAHRFLRRELAAERQDIVFMMGNLGLTRAPCPQVVYIHNPWVVYPESSAWDRCGVRNWTYFRLRNLLISRGLHGCDAVAAQTPVMVERIHRHLRVPYDRLALIPNSVTVPAEDASHGAISPRQMPGHRT